MYNHAFVPSLQASLDSSSVYRRAFSPHDRVPPNAVKAFRICAFKCQPFIKIVPRWLEFLQARVELVLELVYPSFPGCIFSMLLPFLLEFPDSPLFGFCYHNILELLWTGLERTS
jgi:hypothetical protein